MSADVNIKIKIEATKAELQLAKLNAQLSKTQEAAKQAQLKTQLMTSRLKRLDSAAQNVSKGFSVANISLASFVGNITSRAVSSAITGVINGFRAVVQAGREFEDGLVAVGKTTGISGRALDKLGDRITDISRDIPVATKNLLDIATVAGQLGLKSADDIAQFTETLGKLELASDIVGEEGAQSVAKILTVTGELRENGSDNIDKFGNVITRLGNNFAATESQILKVATRVSQGLAGFNVASEDVLALSSALKATGSEAEASGTAVQKTFRLIGKATQDGGEDLKAFADAAGLSTQAFAALFAQDPIKAFEALAVNLGKSGKTGSELNAVLERLGLSDERLVRTLNPLIKNYGELERAIVDARVESEKRTALDQEASTAADTLSSDLQALENAFNDLAKEIFKELGPALRDTVKLLEDTVDVIKTDEFKAFTRFIAETGKIVSNNAEILDGQNAALKTYQFLTGQSAKETETLNKSLEQNANELNSLLPGALQIKDNLVETNDATRDYISLTGDAASAASSFSSAAVSGTEKIRLFEQKKLQDLRKFFRAEEIARLEANFAILKSDKEREAFSKTFISEGSRRQQQAFLKTIGLDRATLESARERDRQLKELRSAQDKFAEEQAAKQEARIEAQKASENDLAIAREANRLFEQEREQIFTEQALLDLQNRFTREEEARIQAGINAAKTEEERQTLINKAVADGESRKLELLQRAADQRERIESQKNRSAVDTARETSNLITAILGNESKEAFAISQAVAFAENIVRTQQALATISGTWAWNPPVMAALQSAEITRGVIRGATIAAATVKGFENGGIVGGTSFTGDRVQARVNSGEMILNRQQQTQLFNIANNRNMGASGTPMNITVQSILDGEVVAESVSKQVANGLVLGEVQ